MQVFMNADTDEWYFELKTHDEYFEDVTHATLAYDLDNGHQLCGFLFHPTLPVDKKKYKVAKQRLHELCQRIIYSYQ